MQTEFLLVEKLCLFLFFEEKKNIEKQKINREIHTKSIGSAFE
jgi:hypothetical protein